MTPPPLFKLRLAFAAFYTSLAALAAVLVTASYIELSPLLKMVLVLSGIGIVGVGAYLLWGTRLWLEGLKEAPLDERIVALRNRSYRLAYELITAAILSGFFYTALGRRWDWWMPSLDVVLVIYPALLLFLLTLPSCVAVWSEKPLAEEDLAG